MAALITSNERKELFKKIYDELGAPVMEVQITDGQLDTLFSNALEDYSKYINEWLVDQQWSTISGLSIEDADFSVAYATKDLNFVKSFTYAYSRQVGLGTNAPAGDNWELKKDFVVISGHTQFYKIPKGREVNEILWSTPSSMSYNTFAGSNWVGTNDGWMANGMMLNSILPAYSTMLASSDRDMKNKLMRSEMTYRITGNADGSKTLHLYPVPGGRYQPTGMGSYFSRNIDGMQVWYWYYETNSKNKNKCIGANSDISTVVRPSDAPIDNLSWGKLNAPARTWVRQYLSATAKMLVGRIRGTYSGVIDITDTPITMDYKMFFDEGQADKEKLELDLKERLDGLTYEHQLEKRANEAENLNRTLQYSPTPIIVI